MSLLRRIEKGQAGSQEGGTPSPAAPQQTNSGGGAGQAGGGVGQHHAAQRAERVDGGQQAIQFGHRLAQ